jgi:nondiscriminating glutamyl-tRNA synthetase
MHRRQLATYILVNTRNCINELLIRKNITMVIFIIRIEDTDLERNVDDAIDSQFDNMEWLGILADESIKHPVEKIWSHTCNQKKFDRYKRISLQISLMMVFCIPFVFCTSEELEKRNVKNKNARGNCPPQKYSRKMFYRWTDETSKKKKLGRETKPFNIRF